MIFIKKALRRLAFTLEFATFFVIIINSLTFKNAFELKIYLDATSHFIHGLNPYFSPDGHFKYPPWSIPFFIPFLLLPLKFSGLIWRGIILFSIVRVFQRLKLDSCNHEDSRLALALAFVINIGSWNSNLQGGQVNVILMYLLINADFLLTPPSLPTQGHSSSQTLREYLGYITFALASSIKVLQVPIIFIFGAHRRLVIAIFVSLLLCLLLLTPSLLQTPFWLDPIGLIRAWLDHAQISELSPGGFKVKNSLGLPSLFVRVFKIKIFQIHHFIISALLPMLAFTLICIKIRSQKKINSLEALSACLSFSGIVGPLVYPYTFAWHFPITYLFLKDFKRHQKSTMILGLTGLIMTYAVHGNSWPFQDSIKSFLFFYSTRSLGVILTLVAFLLTRFRTPVK